jgi:hypothetical protein
MTYRLVRALGAAVLLAGCATTDSLGPSLYGKLGDGDVERAAARTATGPGTDGRGPGRTSQRASARRPMSRRQKPSGQSIRSAAA